MPPHLSHHRGLDVDVGYYHLPDAKKTGFFSPTHSDTLDAKVTWTFIEALLKTNQVEYIFMAYPLQRVLYRHARKLGYAAQALRPVFQYPRPSWEREATIRWVKGHHTHFHVRFLSADQALSEWIKGLWTGAPVKRRGNPLPRPVAQAPALRSPQEPVAHKLKPPSR